MKGLRYIKFIQKERENAIRNSWRLKNVKLKDKHKNIIHLSRKLKLPPILVVKKFLQLEGHTKRECNDAIEGKVEINDFYNNLIQISLENDFINSPLANKRAKERGLEGELILREWFDHLELEYEIDLANGVSTPDLVLAKPMKLFGREVMYIESKCSFGSVFDLRRHAKQFSNFDAFGKGCIVFWFGYEKTKDYFLISGNAIKKLLPDFLQKRVEKMLDFIPPEFLSYYNSHNFPKDRKN